MAKRSDYQTMQAVRPAPSTWTAQDTKDVATVAGCCLIVPILLAVAFFPWIVWFIWWVTSGSPDLFTSWNPYNVTLLILIAISVLGGMGKANS